VQRTARLILLAMVFVFIAIAGALGWWLVHSDREPDRDSTIVPSTRPVSPVDPRPLPVAARQVASRFAAATWSRDRAQDVARAEATIVATTTPRLAKQLLAVDAPRPWGDSRARVRVKSMWRARTADETIRIVIAGSDGDRASQLVIDLVPVKGRPQVDKVIEQ
jgi:hypothetical protein